MHINHINISAPKDLLLAVKAFYCSVLLVTEGYRPAFSRPGYWLYSEGKPIIHLTESDEHFPNEKQGYFDHTAFQSTGLSDMMARLKKLEITFHSAYIKETNVTQLFFNDPAGVGVEVSFVGEKER